MITKDYQGNTLPASYGTTVQDSNRKWLAKLLMNGTELSCGIKSLEITKGSCGSDTEFSIGNIISSMLVAELKELTDAVKGEEIEVRIGLDVGGTYYWITMGTFTIATADKNLYTSTVTGYGKIVSKGGIDFPDLTAPTIAQVGAYIGTELGCTVTLDPSIDDTLTIGAPMVGLTTHQALQVLANTVGGYAIDTADGNVAICLYDDTPTLSVDAGLMVKLPEVEEQDFGITGVRVTVTEESYDEDGTIPAVGYESLTPINLLCENPYMTQALFDDMESHLVGYTYRPATIGLTLGDPRIEGNDVLEVTDADGSVYTVPCHMVKHIYTGGLRSDILAVKPTNSADGIGSISPIQARLDRLNSSVVTANSEASKAQTIAKTTRQHFWFWDTIPSGADPLVGTGAHISEVSEEDFNDPTSPLYHSGGNLLARSNGIAVRDGLVELATFGGSGIRVGKTSDTNIAINTTGANAGFRMSVQNRAGTGSVAITDIGFDSTQGFEDSQNFPKGLWYTFGYRSGTTAQLGYYSFVSGFNNKATHNASIAFGIDNSVYAPCALAIGINNVIGDSSKTSKNSYATPNLSGGSSLAVGYGLKVTGEYQIVAGLYNVANTGARLIIGKGGSDTSRSNAFTVGNDGTVYMANGAHLRLNDNAGSQYSWTEIYASTFSDTSNLYIQADGYIGFYVGTTSIAPTGRMYLQYDHLDVYGYIHANNGFRTNNAQYYYGKNTSGTDRVLCGINSSNEYFYGFGSYTGNEGTVYFDGNAVYIRSKTGIAVTGTSFRPSSANAVPCGSTSYYWTRFYANTAEWVKSDRKAKDVLGSLDFSKDLIMGLNPVQFMLKDSDHRRIHMGFIAQEADAVAKKLDKNLSFIIADYIDEEKGEYLGEEVDDEELTWGLSYTELIAPTIKVVQDQQKELDMLKAEVEELRRKLS